VAGVQLAHQQREMQQAHATAQPAGRPGQGNRSGSGQQIGGPGGDNLTKGVDGLAQRAEAEMSPP
jgi:hypothetical protein